MKKLTYTLIILLTFPTIVWGLPYFEQTQSLIPGQNNKYNLGTTSPSTLRYRTIYTNNLDISGTAINSVLSTNASGVITATSTPTFGHFNATSTTATSTIAGNLLVSGNFEVIGISLLRVVSSGDFTSSGLITGTSFTASSNTTSIFPYASTTQIGSTGSAYFATASGNVGIGTTEPDGKLHVHTATAGSVTATADGSDFVVEGSDNAGMSILTPDASQGQLVFGTPSDSFGAQVTWNHDTDLMQVGTRNAGADLELTTDNGSTVMHLNDSGNVGIGEVAPGSKLSVSGGGSFGAGYDTTAAPTNGLIIEGK